MSPVVARFVTCLVFTGLVALAQPSAAAEQASSDRGNTAEEVTVKVIDAVVIRPIATVRVVVGAALFVPASLFSSPGGKESIGNAYDVLVAAPMEYAFDRKLGDL
jgi:hypothetical protein